MGSLYRIMCTRGEAYMSGHWKYYPEPATVLNSLDGSRMTALLTGNQWMPSQPFKQKMEEPQTAVSPLLGLISVIQVWTGDGSSQHIH